MPWLPSITKLMNCSLVEGVVPKGFKNAIVTPLLKKAALSQDDMKSYRPVSGLSFLSKLVERVVAKQLNNHVQENSLGNKMQSAYRAGHSTETALLAIKNDVHLAMARSEATAVVFLDLLAAFDTIDHETLMGRLKECLDILLPSITKLVNCSLAKGVVPKGFKNAIVTPLLKKASLPQDDMKNYRPVSGLSFLSKLVERVVRKR